VDYMDIRKSELYAHCKGSLWRNGSGWKAYNPISIRLLRASG
jgi:hypothetical protein